MPKKRVRIPSYRLHKPSGQARVIIGGEHIYLGKHGSPESWEKYHRVVTERVCTGLAKVAGPAAISNPDFSVNEFILAYWKHACTYYVKHGRPTDEQAGIRSALRYVRRLYGRTPACEFGPLKLKAVRQAMIEADLSRGVINQYVNRIRRMFRWGVENELASAETHQALMAVSGLRKGRSEARETEPVKPVPDEHVDAVLPHLPEVVRAMVQFQRQTGCRPQDVCIMRPCDVDTSGDIWCYRPKSHKMEHQGRERRIFVGPKAQAVLRSWLDRPSDAYCFSPKESAEASLAKRRTNGSKPRSGSRANGKPKRALGAHYSRYSYKQAIHRACRRAGVPKWNPNQLRHTRGTEVRQQYGLEASQTVLGHSRADVTQLYSERDEKLAQRIAKETG